MDGQGLEAELIYFLNKTCLVTSNIIIPGKH